MRAPLQVMSYADRMQRQQDKSASVLKFLASGEVFTSTDVVAALLQVTPRRAAACLASLVEAGALKCETHFVNGRMLKIYGITPHGCALADAYDAPAFELGRTNSSWINHRLAGQKMRVKAESVGWVNWTAERTLRLQKLRKIPDAVATSPLGFLIAVEIENHCKTPKRYAELIVAYLLEIKAGKYTEVHFVCPQGVDRLIQNSFKKIEFVRLNGESVKLEEKHFARFKFFNFSSWPPAAGEKNA